MPNFGEIAVQIAIVVGLVNLVKKVTNDKIGSYAMVVALGIGIIISILYSMAFNPMSNEIWFNSVMTGVVVGLSASGLYDLREGYANIKK